MTESFRCGDSAALVGYLYDECEPGERHAIAAHVSQCPACTDELDALAGTRQLLSLWVPPEARLGFRVTRETVDAAVAGTTPFGGRDQQSVADVVTGSRAGSSVWWRQPLPAWAQMAAAALIFAAGLTVGGALSGPDLASTAVVARPSSAAVQENLAALERRLADVEQMALARPQTAAAMRPDPAVIMQRVRTEISASEERQLKELASRMWVLTQEQTTQQRLNNEELKAEVNQGFNGVVRLITDNSPR